MLIEVRLLLFILDTSLCIDYIYHIKEGQSPGTFVGDITTDTPMFGIMSLDGKRLTWFSTLQQDATSNSQLFNISKTGVLYTAQILDAESLCKYNTECFKMVDVAVRNKESFVKILEIKVIIEDVNDNYPEFPEKQVNLQFSETDGKGTAKFIPNAIDRDVEVLNSKIAYHLRKNINDPFKLSVSKKVDGTDKLEIILEEKLDREVKDHYRLQIVAQDEGTPSNQGVLKIEISVIDVNDNLPVFAQNVYNVSVNNVLHRSTPVIIMSANDLDSGDNGRILYHFSSKTSAIAKSYFELNEKAGEIYILKNIPSGSKNTYKLFVKATDSGNPPSSSTAIVLVNVNNKQNNAPIIDMNFISKSPENKAAISEGVKVGSFIAFMKITDNDIGQNGEVSCNLNNDKFQLKSLGSKKYKIVVKKPIDKEINNNIDFIITCQDKGSPALETERRFSIQVLDVNDVHPQFTKDIFNFLTYENEDPNFPVGYINATDPDLGLGGQLTYSLMSNAKDVLPFEISDFGFISTTQLLDREQQDVYNFKVFVNDNGKPSLNNTANVVVEVMDKNDNAPYFTFPSVDPFSLDVHYQPQSKNDITVLRASDRDSHVNAFLRYEILGGNNKQLFTVNPYTGMLSFSRTVYQNDAGSYDIRFVVKDSGTPVLSATTTLSLTLTVSNKTARMFTAVHKQSNHEIHINLMIVILVAAVIISVAIVVSITVCIIRRNNHSDILYSGGIDDNNKFIAERRESEYMSQQLSPQYDGQVIMVTDPGNHRNSKATLLRTPGNTWKGSALGIQPQDITQGTHQMSFQDAAVTSGDSKEEKHLVTDPDNFTEISTVSSNADDNVNGLSKGNAVLYETLPGLKTCQQEQLKITDNTSLPHSLSRPKDSNPTTKGVYQPNVGQNTPCNDVIDLKSLRVSSDSPSQPWNLPMRNSFTSYTKPLPAVPKYFYGQSLGIEISS